MTYADRNPDPEFGQTQIIAGLNQLMGSPPTPLDNWISNINTEINKQ